MVYDPSIPLRIGLFGPAFGSGADSLDYMTLFPGYVRDKPRFAALASAVLQQVYDLMALVPSLASGFSVGRAVGVQLDALGASVEIPRQSGWNDETYRSILLRKLRRNQWNGLNDSSFGYVDEGETFCDNGDGTVSSVTVEAVDAGDVMPVPMGIRAIG
jgi:hypothetical protein